MLEPYRIDDFFNLDAAPSTTNDDGIFSLFLDDDFSKLSQSYDFPISTSPDASSSTASHSPAPMFAIDPQLVGTPATSKALSDFDEEEPESDDDDPLPAALATKPKQSRKGTVMSGGIKKAPVPDKENKPKDVSPLKILEPEDWRPSPDEYKKMSSKEKRQLRNKISARNFRVRRKEYISTLEGDIAERDRLIDAIRSELGSSKSENIALRQEITALKKCLLEGRALPDLPPPADLPPVPASPPPTPPVAAASSPVVTPNTQKDLPTSPRLSNRAFWGGLGGMGVTPVHTTFVPPIAVLATKPSTPFSSGSPILKPSIFYEETVRSRVLQENLNPGLNPSSFRGLVEKNGAANINPALNNLNPSLGHGIGAFDTFADVNPFTFKTLDAYRMQLWGKMAAQQHAHQPQPQAQPLTQPLGLASNLKPHFFNSTPTANPAYSTPPSLPSKEHAAAAAIASQTLLSKLGSAFWEAFSGSPTSASKNWDAEKVRKVLDGRAVVKVVDVDAPAPARAPSSVSSMSSYTASSAKTDKPSCKDCLTDLLEESMRSLTLNKK
ncbi:hypothetical protein JVU11DRAFT_8059 [Chiua virens]|nr:hypothetical protein JVU11DRAFT_8059 [Chiua virens]